MAKRKSQSLAFEHKELAHLEQVLDNLESCVFLPVSEALKPVLSEDDWGDFWIEVSQDAPFSWGDNNRSLVTAEAFVRHCAQRLDPTEKNREIFRFLLLLGDLYLDLEN